MKASAGILLYRRLNNGTEVLLVHPGGPFWRNKDEGSWTIPKGEINATESALTAACREFSEETGMICTGPYIELPAIIQRSGKKVYAWATEGEMDTEKLVSNNFEIEWPVRSGKMKQFPEIDKAAWFKPELAKQKIK